MTAKNKAKELYEKIFVITPEYLTNDECVSFAKQCALIAVDEIIKTGLLIEKTLINVPSTKIHIEFWEDVKKEIEKL